MKKTLKDCKNFELYHRLNALHIKREESLQKLYQKVHEVEDKYKAEIAAVIEELNARGRVEFKAQLEKKGVTI